MGVSNIIIFMSVNKEICLLVIVMLTVIVYMFVSSSVNRTQCHGECQAFYGLIPRLHFLLPLGLSTRLRDSVRCGCGQSFSTEGRVYPHAHSAAQRPKMPSSVGIRHSRAFIILFLYDIVAI